MPSARYILITAALFLFLYQLATPASGQYGISLNIKKPKEFENRTLKAEKTQKKFTAPRRFFQNLTTHYNYFFNANNKLNSVLERAKLSFKDDYAELIPFYNYSLDVTASDSIELDSISYKSQTGIVLHDLRSDWADNLYLLWGASYYLQKQFDSAYLMFQFINYAFAPKEKDGYYLTIGSARDGNRATSISTKEKSNLTNRMFKEPPSRNDAFIWQIRNHLAQEQFADASSLIIALKNDSVFPSRLRNDLEEVQAYYFYRQSQWDSTASHLELALSNATNQQERARWEYLLAQLYERTGKFEQSAVFYDKAIHHTTDPIMDIYARLGTVRVNKDDEENTIEKNIATLIKMAHRDKYVDYRDIIYYMAAQMELERNNVDAAILLLEKSTRYVSNNKSQRNKAFLQLANLTYTQRRYRASYNYTDSLQLDDPELKNTDEIIYRKTILATLIAEQNIIARQDSLQKLAAMEEGDRRDYVRKLTRKIRRQQGLKDEGVTSTGSVRPNAPPPTLFAEAKKGEWYFYNATSRDKGNVDFKVKWGTRPNTDNWRRSASQTGTIRTKTPNDPNDPKSGIGPDEQPEEEKEITFDGLYSRIPLTDSSMRQSNDSINNAMFSMGKILIQQLEDCQTGTATFEELRNRAPKYKKMDEVLFNLYYCYRKNGDSTRTADLRNQLGTQFGKSSFNSILTTGKDPNSTGPDKDATKIYEQIYDLFIEGQFEEAIQRKKSADSTFGNNFWTPQLLYIEAVYYIKQRDDSTAKQILNSIVNQFGDKPLGEKAKTMLDVLNRRAQIEEELTNLVIVMPEDDTTTRYRETGPPTIVRDTAVRVMPEPKDTVVKQPPVVKPPPVNTQKPTIDTIATKPIPPPVAFNFDAEKPHYVVLILNKVDPVFVNEAKNAFYRYNRDTYYNKQMQAELVEVDADNRILLISPFKNAAEATAYVDQTRPKTSTEIIPWLKNGKFTYTIISDTNLEVLKAGKDLEKYRQFIDKNIPGKF